MQKLLQKEDALCSLEKEAKSPKNGLKGLIWEIALEKGKRGGLKGVKGPPIGNLRLIASEAGMYAILGPRTWRLRLCDILIANDRHWRIDIDDGQNPRAIPNAIRDSDCDVQSQRSDWERNG